MSFLALAYPQSALHPAGPVAREQLSLIIFSFAIMTLVFVVVMGLLLYVLVRFRRRNHEGDPPQVEGNNLLELIWTGIPVILIIILAIPTLRTTFALAKVPDDRPVVKVDVVAHQFWWEFRYPELGITTANELVVPVGYVIDFHVTSQDVVHSFWVPRLGGKLDAIPGRNNHFWLQADEPGWYPGQCAQLCGESHSLMAFAVDVRTPEEFDAWVKKMKEPFQPPTSALEKEGMDVFAQSCQSCHAIAGTDFKGTIGPDLTKVGLRRTLGALTLRNTPEDMKAWIHDPASFKPGVLMPQIPLTDQQLNAVVAFLQSQK
ncbi:MAG: cytochrome c oxidase subunit II [Clostridiales bacterium]|nr:cytochrome c oxidase subunit II [Clostridiales bacterium]